METISSISSTAASVTQKVSEGVTETASSAAKSVPQPSASPGLNFSNLSSFQAFDPAALEKAPSGFNISDPIKDTVEITSNKSGLIANDVAPTLFNFYFSKPSENNFSDSDFETLLEIQNSDTIQVEQISNIENITTTTDFEQEFEKMIAEDTESAELTEAEKHRILEVINDTKKLAGPSYDDLTNLKNEPENSSEEQEEVIEDEPVYLIENEDQESTELDSENEEESEETSISPEEDEDEDEDEDEEDKKQPVADPDDINKITNKHVVDFEAVQARIKDAELSISSIDLKDKTISGQKISNLMNQVPSLEETSQVLAVIPTFKDGSYSETLEDISNLEFSDRKTALKKVKEIIMKKPPIMLDQAGVMVGKTDVDRVFKYVDNPKGTTLDSIHT